MVPRPDATTRPVYRSGVTWSPATPHARTRRPAAWLLVALLAGLTAACTDDPAATSAPAASSAPSAGPTPPAPDGDAPARSDVTVVRYGPEAVGAAHLARAYLLDRVRPEFVIDRRGRTVDVVLGEDFNRLATPTEFNQTLAMMGAPGLPPGTCELPR
jgi:hypothetical protein